MSADTYDRPHVYRDRIVQVTISRDRVAVEWLSENVVSDAIATKKKAFIRGSPLARRKKGLGEGKSPRVDTPGTASRRWQQRRWS